MECAINDEELGLFSAYHGGTHVGLGGTDAGHQGCTLTQRHLRLACLVVAHVEKYSRPLDSETCREGQRAEADIRSCLRVWGGEWLSE